MRIRCYIGLFITANVFLIWSVKVHILSFKVQYLLLYRNPSRADGSVNSSPLVLLFPTTLFKAVESVFHFSYSDYLTIELFSMLMKVMPFGC